MARSTRRSASAQLSARDLSTQERLLLSQVVHACGTGDWAKVSQILSVHPLIAKLKQDAFSPEACQTLYAHLMAEAELESSDGDKVPRKGPNNLKLAQKFYQARVVELRELIAAEEAHFKIVAAEIDEIRSGAWDERIRERLGLAPTNEEDKAPPAEEAPVLKSPEVIDIDISEDGVTPPADEVRTTLILAEELIDLVPTPPHETPSQHITVDSPLENVPSHHPSPVTESLQDHQTRSPKPDAFLDAEDQQSVASLAKEGSEPARSLSPKPDSAHHPAIEPASPQLSPVTLEPEIVPDKPVPIEEAPPQVLTPPREVGEPSEKERKEKDQEQMFIEELGGKHTPQTPERSAVEPEDVDTEIVTGSTAAVTAPEPEDVGMDEIEAEVIVEENAVHEAETIAEEQTEDQVVAEDMGAVGAREEEDTASATRREEAQNEADRRPREGIVDVIEADDTTEPEIEKAEEKAPLDERAETGTHFEPSSQPEPIEPVPVPVPEPVPGKALSEGLPEDYSEAKVEVASEVDVEAVPGADTKAEVGADVEPDAERESPPKAEPSPHALANLDAQAEEEVEAVVEELDAAEMESKVDSTVDVKSEESDGEQPAESLGRSLLEDKDEVETEPASPEVIQPDAEPTPGSLGQIETPHDVDMEEATPEVSTPSEFEPTIEFKRSRRGKRKASEAASEMSESSRDKKKAREQSQSIEEDRPSPSVQRRGGRPTRNFSAAEKKFQSFILMLHGQIYSHRYGNIFHNPIKPTEAPDYHDIVKRPIDLKTIKARVRNGTIATSAEYQRDVFLMFANSMMYNRPNSDIYNMAADMMSDSVKRISDHITTEGIIKGRG